MEEISPVSQSLNPHCMGIMREQSLSLYGSSPSSEKGGKNISVATTGEWNASNAWNVNVNNGNVNNWNSKGSAGYVRPVCAHQDVVYDIPLESFIEAAELCARKKRTSKDCIEFSLNLQDNIVELWRDCVTGKYEPSPSDVFIVKHPVKREVFGAAYRDRVVHHWIAKRIEPLLEKRFVRQGDVSKNCRKGFGCLAAVKSLAQKMESITADYSIDATVIKLDVKAFFMSIDKDVLWWMLEDFLLSEYNGEDKDFLMWVLKKTIDDAPQEHFVRCSRKEDWKGLPADKSLLYNSPRRGIAIGKLISQLSANFYMSVLAEYLIEELKVDALEMFMDDFVIIDTQGADHAKKIVSKVRSFLNDILHVKLHPKKIYIQPCKHGVLYVGAMIKPGRIYISNRTLSTAFRKIHFYNDKLKKGKGAEYAEKLVATMNSYLGLMIHYNSYNRREKLIRALDDGWYEYVYVAGHLQKLVLKRMYRKSFVTRRNIRNGKYKQYFMPELDSSETTS